MQHPLFEIVTTTAGAISIRNKALNEIMHNPVGPWAEANALYVVQSRLAERLSEHTAGELVLFDVGLGAAANALAALHCAQALGPQARRALRLVSFERDLELLRYALSHAEKFAHFAGYEAAIAELLRAGSWSGEKVHWQLHHGDFLQTLPREEARPHLIFFDPYSPKMNFEMWSTACFRKIYQQSRSAEEGGTILYTYSQATPIRAALLAAGFFVGYGRPSGPKEETTQAATDLAALTSPLGAVWYKRWQCSHAQLPYDCPPEEAETLRNWIARHVQFQS